MRWTDAPLRFYGEPADQPRLEWSWVDRQLTESGTYWLNVATPSTHPHPRPVWGVWHDDRLHLSLGSRVLGRAAQPDTLVSVHLDSGTDVVILEGTVTGPTIDTHLIVAYNAKYDYSYDVNGLGPLTTITPDTAMAWRSAGWAGRDGFQHVGRWRHIGGSG
jgi:hypothetical protein